MTTEELTPAEVRRAALSAYRADCCVVVVKEDGSKYPDLQEWKEYTRKRPDEALLKMWYSGNRTGMGLICGAVSGNLETFEFDDQPTYLMFKALAIASGLGDLVARIEEGYSEQSPNGIHWLTRCSEVGGNIKLARRLKRPEEMKDPNDKIKTLIETRGNGGFIITAPSYGKVHPTGQPYRLLKGGFDSIATITAEERADLFELARSFDQMSKRVVEEPPDKGAGKSGVRPVDDFNARGDWGHLLESHGWRLVFERNGVGHWRRPGKDRGISATTNFQGSDLLYVFSTSTLFEELRGYSKFSAYALLEHGGDFKAAVKALAGLGYGQS
ncbi:MAG TPA: bifunctional DNA primase/polymerase, partial [Dehalococcoidia bacterium]|nr:bifunctional DNA primase/polymerase [Dehalococcoidia bacterium]